MKLFKKYIYHPLKNLIAKYYLVLLRSTTDIKVIGITGSSGKTTTKEMISSILRLEGNTVWSKDNIDPVYNIATTILRCNFSTKYLVSEMGIEFPNEMDFYLWLVKPDIGVITNIFPTHTLYLGDIEGVFTEKSKLVKNTKIAILNKDNKFLLRLKSKLKARKYWFKSDINPIISNANAATEIAKVLGISGDKIEEGLLKYENPKHRLSIIKHKSGAVLLDDTYNSNPKAFLSALNYFNSLSKNGKKIAVIGDMLELGKIEVKEHQKIAKLLKDSNFIKVIGVGKLVKYVTNDVYTNPLEVLPEIKKYLKPKTFILFKGSRSIGLDKLVDKL